MKLNMEDLNLETTTGKDETPLSVLMAHLLAGPGKGEGQGSLAPVSKTPEGGDR